MSEPTDFEEFWQAFLSDHRSPANRWAHVAGAAGGLLGLATTLASRRPAPLLLGAVAFAAFAVGGHPIFEGNRAKNFGRPWFATRAFARLCVRTVSGTVSGELDRLD